MAQLGMSLIRECYVLTLPDKSHILHLKHESEVTMERRDARGRRVIEVEGLEEAIVIREEGDDDLMDDQPTGQQAEADMVDNLSEFIDLSATLDVETVLHVVSPKLLDHFTVWDLIMQKAKLNVDSGALASILHDAVTVLCELKLLIERCLEPVKEANNVRSGVAKRNNKKKAGLPVVTEQRVEVDTMLAMAMGLDTDVWRKKRTGRNRKTKRGNSLDGKSINNDDANTGVAYYNNIINLFPDRSRKAENKDNTEEDKMGETETPQREKSLEPKSNFINLSTILDAETVLHVVSPKLLDHFTVWDLIMQKAKLNVGSGTLASILHDAVTVLCELKLLVEGCLEPVKETNVSSTISEKNRNQSGLTVVNERRVEVDTRLAMAMGLDTDVWRKKRTSRRRKRKDRKRDAVNGENVDDDYDDDEDGVGYYSNMLNVEFLFPGGGRNMDVDDDEDDVEEDDVAEDEVKQEEPEMPEKEPEAEPPKKMSPEPKKPSTRSNRRRKRKASGDKDPLETKMTSPAKRSTRSGKTKAKDEKEKKEEEEDKGPLAKIKEEKGPEEEEEDDEVEEEGLDKKAAEVKPEKKINGAGRAAPAAATHQCEACKRWYTSEAALDSHHEKSCPERDPMDLKFEEIKGNGFKCEFADCDVGEEVFPTRADFAVHWADAHVPDHKKMLRCGNCGARFATKAARRAHAAREHDKNFKCETCGRRFYNEKALLLHDQGHQKVTMEDGTEMMPGAYLCLKCGTSLCKAYGKMHEEKCTGINVRHPEYKVVDGEYFCTAKNCDIGYGFNSVYGLRKHFHEAHIGEDEKYFPCDYCGKKFSFNTTRNKHIKAVHLKSYICKICGRAFGGNDKLTGHMFTHSGEKPFQCDKCDYKSSKRYNLEMHRQAKHSVVTSKNFVCSVCNKQFVTMGRVRRHMDLMHKDGAPTPTRGTWRPRRPRRPRPRGTGRRTSSCSKNNSSCCRCPRSCCGGRGGVGGLGRARAAHPGDGGRRDHPVHPAGHPGRRRRGDRRR